MKKALITGISGQDGHFLSKLLLEKEYEVHGIILANDEVSLGTLKYLPKEQQEKINLHIGNISDKSFIDKTIKEIIPDEIYHLAAQSQVGTSFENPQITYEVNIGGTLKIINAIKEFSPKSKFYFAGSSEMFGRSKNITQNENSPFYPKSPYGVSKLAGYWAIKEYRENYNLFMVNGILFNHESEFRGLGFVTRKISQGIANIKFGNQKNLTLGNIDAKRDWGYAKDYVEGMWLMLQQEKPDDYVLATGKSHSVREFVKEGFKIIGKEIEWKGTGSNEIGVDSKTQEVLIKISPELFRPVEIEYLLGDYTKAKEKLGWEPKTKFKELVKIMVEHDLNSSKQSV